MTKNYLKKCNELCQRRIGYAIVILLAFLTIAGNLFAVYVAALPWL
jgi:hypothetical protein